MLKQILSLMLIGFLISVVAMKPAIASAKVEDQAFANRVKQAVSSLGTGETVRVKIKLQNDTKIKGYISEIAENDFTVVTSKDKVGTKVPYPQVKQIKRNNLSGLGIAGIVAGGVILAAFLINVFGD